MIWPEDNHNMSKTMLTENVPVTEVKFLLDSTRALCDSFRLTDDVRDFFHVTRPEQNMRIWYLDTADQSLFNAGWQVRYRYHDHCDLELTYKKRFEKIQYHAICRTQAGKAFAKKFEPEIDMTYSKVFYSLSCIKYFPLNQSRLHLSMLEAKRLAIKNSPGIFTNWGGKNKGFEQLCDTVLFGPVHAVEYKGTYQGMEMTFEVWKLDSFLPEISFDIDTNESEEAHRQLLSDLEKKRLVLPENTLKTHAFFHEYAKRGKPVCR